MPRKQLWWSLHQFSKSLWYFSDHGGEDGLTCWFRSYVLGKTENY